eukprot:12902380-Prorocentrum_lima.AAC.1
MLPGPNSCTPRSQGAFAEAASSSEPAARGYNQVNAAMTREFTGNAKELGCQDLRRHDIVPD